MPKLLIFSDIHNDGKALARLMEIEADYYVCAGDLVTFAKGFEKMAPYLIPKKDRVYLIPGNHESESDIARFCAEHGFHNLHGKTLEIIGTGKVTHIAALGYSNITPFNTPGEYPEEELTRRLAPFADLKPLVLICHCPPKDTALDQIKPGLHAGSPAVRAFIEANQPEHFFCGHIHEAEGVVIQMGATRAMNVGKLGFVLEL